MHLAAAAVLTATATAAVMPSARVRTEDEPRAEDDGDDEHDARHDAHPGGDDVEPARSAWVLQFAPLDDWPFFGGGGADGAGY